MAACGADHRIPLHCLTATWRQSHSAERKIEAGHGGGGEYYAPTVHDYAAFFGFAATEVLRGRVLDNGGRVADAGAAAVAAEAAAEGAAAGGAKDLLIAAIAGKIVDQVAGTMGSVSVAAWAGGVVSMLSCCSRVAALGLLSGLPGVAAHGPALGGGGRIF